MVTKYLYVFLAGKSLVTLLFLKEFLKQELGASCEIIVTTLKGFDAQINKLSEKSVFILLTDYLSVDEMEDAVGTAGKIKSGRIIIIGNNAHAAEIIRQYTSAPFISIEHNNNLSHLKDSLINTLLDKKTVEVKKIAEASASIAQLRKTIYSLELTPLEKKCIALLKTKLKNNGIASHLGLSPASLTRLMGQIADKLNTIHTRSAILVAAYDKNVISPDEQDDEMDLLPG